MEKLEEHKWPVLKGLTISLFFLFFFIKGKLLGESRFYNHLDLVLGVYYYFLILYPLLLTSTVLLDNKRKERVLRIRLYSGIIFFFFCTFLTVIKGLDGNALELSAREELVRVSWGEMNLGGAATSIMDFLYFNIERKVLDNILIIGTFISGFILFAKMITEFFREIFRALSRKKERKKLKEEKEGLAEKISIKEKVDKKMNLAKKETLKQQEEKIQMEVDKFIDERIEVEGEEIKVISLDDLMNLTKKQHLKVSESKGDKREISCSIEDEVDNKSKTKGEKDDISI